MQIIVFLSLTLIIISLLAVLAKKRSSTFSPKNFLPSVLKNIDEAILVLSSNLEVKFASERCERLFKYSNQELIGKKLGQLFENNQAYNELIQGMLVKELNILDSHNNKIPVTISLRKILKWPKRSIGFIIIITDISETKNYHKTLEEKTREIEQKNDSLKKLQQELELEKTSAEEKIKQEINNFEKEHSRLLASINNISFCFLIADKYNNVILNNKAAKNIFASLNAERQTTITELQKTERINIDLNKQIEKSQSEKKTLSLADVQINSKFVKIFISPIILDSKQTPDAIGAVIIIEDETAAYNLKRSKEDLFSIASHELRTPLTAIYGYTALVKQMYFGNIQNEELKTMINNIGILSKKLSLSVSNFLDSSKLEQGKIELKKEQCDLFTLINNSIKEIEGIALGKNLYIKFNPPPSPIIITVDQIRFTQILNILINNAIMFTRSGGIYIFVETKSNFVKIIVQDTGLGIADENKRLIFRKFQSTGDDLSTRQEGTGLGLYTAKLLTEKMGGLIQLEKTELNKGSTFSFTIPMDN